MSNVSIGRPNENSIQKPLEFLSVIDLEGLVAAEEAITIGDTLKASVAEDKASPVESVVEILDGSTVPHVIPAPIDPNNWQFMSPINIQCIDY